MNKKTALPGSLVLTALLSLAVSGSSGSPNQLLITHAMIVDPAKKEVKPGSIWIDQGRIREITADVPMGFSGRIFDVEGKYVMPGLYDLHTHAYGNLVPNGQVQFVGIEGAGKRMLAVGVTTFLDLFSPENDIFSLRDRQRAGEAVSGAEIYAAGPILTCTHGHGTEYGVPTRVVDSPADAVREVTDLAKHKPDVVKLVYDHAFIHIMPTMTRETMEAIVKTAKSLDIKTVAHIGTWDDVRDVIRAGITAYTHTPGEAIMPEDVIAMMKASGTYQILTLGVQTELSAIVENPKLLDNPMLKSLVQEEYLDSYRHPESWSPRSQRFLDWQNKIRGNVKTSTALVSRGGVKYALGTDIGNLGVFVGYSVHRDLQLMVEWGVPSWDAIRSATLVPAEFLGLKGGFEPGADANLLILSANPVEDITATQRIEGVIQHGKEVDRAAMLRP